MTRLNRWPPAPRDELVEPELPDFDETITSGLDDTVRSLRTLDPQRVRREEYTVAQLDVIYKLVDENRRLSKTLAKVVELLKTKASKGQFEQLHDALTAKVEKRLDNLRNLVLLAIAVLGALLTIIKVKT